MLTSTFNLHKWPIKSEFNHTLQWQYWQCYPSLCEWFGLWIFIYSTNFNEKKNCHLFIGDELLWLNTCSDFYRYCVKLGVYTGWRIIWAWCSQRWTHKQNLYNNRKVHRHFWRGFFFSTWSWTFIKEFFSPTCCFK